MPVVSSRFVTTLGVVCGLAMVAGCAATGQDGQAARSCSELNGTTVPAASIGLATRGATVTATQYQPPVSASPKSHQGYCKVLGDIAPVDPQAPAIKFQLNLPAHWNGKSLMIGGGGYNGVPAKTTDLLPAGPVDKPDPIGLGYATYGSDSGHQLADDPANPGKFALNQEALRNFAYEALKKTHDTAQYLIAGHYGKSAQLKYFAGGSTGGREALAVIQKWPRDFNGVIALYPAFAAASLDLQFGRITRALAQPGAYPNQQKREVLYKAGMQACDGLDGVRDGLISNQRQCNRIFDPARATVDGRPLRCEGGADMGNQCLSDAQIRAMKVFASDIVFNPPLGSGEVRHAGFNTWGVDLGRPAGDSKLQATVNYLNLGSIAPAYPMPPNPAGSQSVPYHAGFWDQWAKYFITQDPAFNSLSLDPTRPGKWRKRINELTRLQDINQTDLSAFANHGGKLLIAHGVADGLVPTRATEDYVRRVRATMGKQKADQFLRYYEIPGYGHAVSTVFNASWDSLGALENWVEKGAEPGPQVVADTAGVPGRTRPLCEYPAWPRYTGSGDVNQAASFECARQ